MIHQKKMFAVVCRDLHWVGGPYSSSPRAQIAADSMNARSEAVERMDPNARECRYQVIDFIVLVPANFVAIGQEPERLN